MFPCANPRVDRWAFEAIGFAGRRFTPTAIGQFQSVALTSQVAGKQPLTPGAWRSEAAAGYSANVPQPHDLIPAANSRRPRVPPTLEPPHSTRGQAWTARAGPGSAHLGGTRRVARHRACSIVASRSTSRPGLPNAATVTTTPGRCRPMSSGSSVVTCNAEPLPTALPAPGAGSVATTS